MTIVFLNSSQKTLEQGNIGPKFIFFISHETLLFDKFEGADFKYDNSFSKF